MYFHVYVLAALSFANGPLVFLRSVFLQIPTGVAALDTAKVSCPYFENILSFTFSLLVVSCHVVSCCIASCCVVLCRIASCLVLWCRVVLCRVVRCGVVLCFVVFFSIMEAVIDGRAIGVVQAVVELITVEGM